MSTRSQLRTKMWAMLGTTSTDRAFPASTLDLWLDDAFNGYIGDLPGSYLITSASITPDGGTGRIYTLSTQSTPITNLRQIRELRVTDNEGIWLTPIDDADLQSEQGDRYSLIGPDESTILETSPTVSESATLYCKYAYWPTFGTGDSDVPSALPTHFHDLLALEGAKLAYGQGDESNWPRVYEERLIDRRAQFRLHCGMRGGIPQRQRTAAA